MHGIVRWAESPSRAKKLVKKMRELGLKVEIHVFGRWSTGRNKSTVYFHDGEPVVLRNGYVRWYDVATMRAVNLRALPVADTISSDLPAIRVTGSD